jgi:hypothetical protein
MNKNDFDYIHHYYLLLAPMMIKQYMNKNNSDYITIIFIHILFYHHDMHCYDKL